MKRLLIGTLFLCTAFVAHAQYGGPRLFWDVPGFYVTAPEVANISNQIGLSAETAFNVATHWATARAGFGTAFSLDPQSDQVDETFLTTPYFLVEGGLGLYRTNSNQCAASHRSAFTAMGIIGFRYNMDLRDSKPAEETESVFGPQFVLGAEFGYFFIRDVFRNTEFVLRGTYYPGAQVLSAQLGFKFFLNAREFGRY
jgi:hypothetical protein